MSGLSSLGGFDPSPWIAANAALAARLGTGRRNGLGLSCGSGSFAGESLVSWTITGDRDEERARRLRGISARGAKGAGGLGGVISTGMGFGSASGLGAESWLGLFEQFRGVS